MGDNTREVERTFIGHLIEAFLDAAPDGARIDVSKERRDGRALLYFSGRVGGAPHYAHYRIDVEYLLAESPGSEGRHMARIAVAGGASDE